MGNLIWIIAAKGGAGKTTVTVALGFALARRGKRVCLLDMCAGMRALDLPLRMQNLTVYDWGDLADGVCTMEQALLPVKAENTLWFLPAPMEERSTDEKDKSAVRVMERLCKRFDYIVADAGTVRSGRTLRPFAALISACLLVTVPGDEAARNTETLAARLRAEGIDCLNLLINGLRPSDLRTGRAENPQATAQYLDIPLLGVIPFDEGVMDAALRGEAPNAVPPRVWRAIEEMARRLAGETVPFRFPERRKQWSFRVKEG